MLITRLNGHRAVIDHIHPDRYPTPGRLWVGELRTDNDRPAEGAPVHNATWRSMVAVSRDLHGALQQLDRYAHGWEHRQP